MNLAVRDQRLRELMDDPDCDPVVLQRTLQRFGTVNRLVSGWGSVYRSRLRPALRALGCPARVLDIGCGAGDVLRRLVRQARRDGFELTGLGIDPDARALEVARRSPPVAGISYRNLYSRDLVTEGAPFDIVISNHLLHHLDDSAFDTLMSDSALLASELAVHSDIARGQLAYAAYAAGITPLAPGTFLRVDGLRSIRRSYTRDELAAQLPENWSAEQASQFRLLAVYRAGSMPR